MHLAQPPPPSSPFTLPSSVRNINNNKGPAACCPQQKRPLCLPTKNNNKPANPGKKSSKPVSRPGVENKSEVKGAFIINDSLRNELLKLPDLVRPSGSSGHIITPVVPVLLPPPVTTTQVSLTPPSNLPNKKDHEVLLPHRNVVAVEEIPRFYRESSPPTEFTAKSVPASGKIAEEPQTMSLIEQKRQQWAKEREELHGLWSPWGKANNPNNTLDSTLSMNNPKTSTYSSLMDNNNLKATSPGTSVVTASYVAGLGLSTKASSSLAYPHNDVYLPPISGAEQSAPGGTGRRSTATTTTTSWAITASNNNQDMLRKSSLPNRMQASAYSSQVNLRRESHPVGQYHQPYHNHSNISEEHSPSMAEWNKTSSRRGSMGGTDNYAVYRTEEEQNNNINNSRRYLGDTEDYNITMERGSGRSPGRVIVHKIYMERGDSEEMDERMSRSLIMEPSSSLSPNVIGPGGDNNMTNMQQREFGGSMGYLGLGKPPAAAMRSSLTIGLDPSYAQSLEIIEKQEKQKWLAELEQQREEQRVRKLMEKDDKRARWGDRGIGVGHFWEPSDSAMSRLPASASPYHHPQHGNLEQGMEQQMFSPSPPPWLERSLERMVTSKSLTNLNGDGNENAEDIQPYIGGPGTTNRFINHSSSDLRNINENGEGDNNEEKSFARGHNSLLDPDIKSEMEKKRQANHEHLEALKKQMEEKRMRQEEEKQRQLKEERDHEERMEQQRELELRRLEREKRKENGWPSISDLDDLDQSTISNQVQMTNDSMTDEDFPKHESPLIPHQVEEGLPDAYELEIARRQSLLMAQKSSMFNSMDENNAGGAIHEASSMIDIRHEGQKIDQCLMTDSDHIYERTLTPTTERKRSASLGRSEFGTQTEQEDFSSGGSGGDRRGARKSRGGNKSKGEEEKPKDEKPRWGANPVKKQYLKQSEKDPYYMQRLRKRNQRTRQGDSTGTDDSEGSHSGQQRGTQSSQPDSQANSIPFSRIRSRKLSRSPVKTPMGPLKAVHGVKKTEEVKNQLIESSQSQTTITSAQRSLGRNFPSDPQLHKGSIGKRMQGAKGMNGIVRQSLGSISGLNSVGGSEGSGSGYTSPSIGGARNSLGSGGSDSLRSGSVNSPAVGGDQYIPTFSNDFIPMREFDEIPINAGKIAPGFRKAFGMEDSSAQPQRNHRPLSPIIGGYTSESTSNKGRTVSSSATTTNTDENKRSANKSGNKSVERTTSTSSNKSSKNKYGSSDLEPVNQDEYFSTDRLSSPPVPALRKKLQMGFHTDESGRLSSLPPDILSPLPPLKIGTPIPSISDMRISSSVPKLDIDIAVTPSSNEDLQRLLETVREQVRLSSRGEVTTASSSESHEDEMIDPVELRKELKAYERNEMSLKRREQEETQDDDQEDESQEEDDDDEDEQEEEDTTSSPREQYTLPEPERFKLPGILPDPFPPIELLSSRTLESEVSFNLQEEFINTLMSQKEVQEQLTAREKELCEKGIIEFNVRLPSRWAHRKNPMRCNSTSKILDDYKDPLASERRRNTASWLRNADDPPATESVLNNLTSLRQLSTSLKRR